jgi:hypothetical protein
MVALSIPLLIGLAIAGGTAAGASGGILDYFKMGKSGEIQKELLKMQQKMAKGQAAEKSKAMAMLLQSRKEERRESQDAAQFAQAMQILGLGPQTNQLSANAWSQVQGSMPGQQPQQGPPSLSRMLGF